MAMQFYQARRAETPDYLQAEIQKGNFEQQRRNAQQLRKQQNLSGAGSAVMGMHELGWLPKLGTTATTTGTAGAGLTGAGAGTATGLGTGVAGAGTGTAATGAAMGGGTAAAGAGAGTGATAGLAAVPGVGWAALAALGLGMLMNR